MLNKFLTALIGLFLINSSFGMEQQDLIEDTKMNDTKKFVSDLTLMNTLDPSLLKEITNVLSIKFEQDVQIESIVQLSEPERRNRILRVILQSKDGIPHSLIFKQALSGNIAENERDLERFSRDYAGLAFLDSLSKQVDSTTPHFYGGSLKYRFVLLEDLGENHISLVDSLTGDNPERARAALCRFVTCLGKFHADSYGNTDQYIQILKSINPNAELEEANADQLLSEMKTILSPFKIPLSDELIAEIRQVIRANLETGPFTTYIHGDICPDNVFDDPIKDKLRLIDFEWGRVRNALLDGTYFRMGWPTCWCAKALPNELITHLEALYREQLMTKIPAARDDKAYQNAYTNACAFWMLSNLDRIDKVMESDRCGGSGPTPKNSKWDPQKNLVRPRILTRIQAFINVSEGQVEFQNIRFMAQKILEELQRRWSDVKPMDFYPAFEEKFG